MGLRPLLCINGMNNAQSIRSAIEAMAVSVLPSCGVELYELEYAKEKNGWVLRLYIDKEGNVGLDDCERVSKAMEAALDISDPIPNPYNLEVSSPGIERALTRQAHYDKYMGQPVAIKLFKARDGQKKHFGILKGAGDDFILIETPDNSEIVRFERNEVSSCRLRAPWDQNH